MRTKEQRQAIAEKIGAPFIGDGPVPINDEPDERVMTVIEPDGRAFVSVTELAIQIRKRAAFYGEKHPQWRDALLREAEAIDKIQHDIDEQQAEAEKELGYA
jgi:hypothetical protein